ncbi:carboxymuconolactone decarboxylase family protein [Lentzea sp. NPDC004782]|uniref:carboxymuconolactone decarboxylase family protein n=1 Tax=Lentzea sp. NPDC004782 TaxID=3154458 RepID=UPI0033B829B2
MTTVDTGSRRRGLKVMDEVYGTGFTDTLPSEYTPMLEKTVEHLFGEIWNRPGLSIRDRRLLVIGATAALGRADLIEIQVRGALANRELSAEELREAVLQLQYYVGWGNGSQVHNGVEVALRTYEKEDKR